MASLAALMQKETKLQKKMPKIPILFYLAIRHLFSSMIYHVQKAHLETRVAGLCSAELAELSLNVAKCYLNQTC